MTYCVHCGLPAEAACSEHVQSIARRKRKTVAKAATRQDSIHPRVRNGRTVHAKVNTCGK